MSKATLEYLWVKHITDEEGNSFVIPQFDFTTGIENKWSENIKGIIKVALVPFTVDLANKVLLQKVSAVATTNPTFEFKVYPGETVEAGRDNAITYYDYFKCGICGSEFKHFDSSKFAECPNCGARDEWFCSRCHEYKLDFRTTEKGQIQCLDCDIPIGLDRTRNVHRMTAISHTCDYFIRTETRRLLVKDNGVVTFE